MSCRFVKADLTAQPTWGTIVPTPGNFSRFPTVSGGTEEVGYGEGGYGEDGYDSPSTSVQAAATPNWTIVLVPICAGSGIVLFDSLGVRWVISIDTSGHLITTARSSGPLDAFTESPIILVDSANSGWLLSIDTTGHLITTLTTAQFGRLASLPIDDSNGADWNIIVLTNGDLKTSQ